MDRIYIFIEFTIASLLVTALYWVIALLVRKTLEKDILFKNWYLICALVGVLLHRFIVFSLS